MACGLRKPRAAASRRGSAIGVNARMYSGTTFEDCAGARFEATNWNVGAAYALSLLVVCTLFIFLMWMYQIRLPRTSFMEPLFTSVFCKKINRSFLERC